MIRKDKKELLRPVRGWFVLFSLFLALIINFIPFNEGGWRPDAIAIVLLYWAIHQPERISFIFVLCLGLLMDTHYGIVLGQHSLAYVLLCFFGVLGSKRIVLFDQLGQIIHVLPLFFLFHLLLIVIYRIQGISGFEWIEFLKPMIETLLWPLVSFILLLPQRIQTEKKSI